jgi:NADH:ubiquinone oxidoreductase subunit K
MVVQMEENHEINNKPEEQPNPPTQPAISESPTTPETDRKTVIMLIVGVVLIVGVAIAALVLLLNQTADTTSHIRDIFIILMALESLVIGVALVILITQLAILINLLQNEIKPIIHSTNETVNTVKGTAEFLSNNLSEPVIKLNEYMASLKKLLDLLKIGK